MNTPMSWLRSQAARGVLAKLVIAISAFVALADSAIPGPPQWSTAEQAQAQIVFADQNEWRAILSIELSGPLYADLTEAEVQITATADRTASDLELSVRPVEPGPDAPAQLEPASETDADLQGGSEPGSAVPRARANPMTPNVVFLSVPLQCASEDPDVPRAESCLEQLEITLARDPQRPVSVDLTVGVSILGAAETEPNGTFEVHLEELAP